MAGQRWTLENLPDQNGRTVLITGANSGLGLASAEALAAAGARVLLGCRNADKAATALEEVKAVATGPAPEVVSIDLADLESVQAAADVVDAQVERLDVLLNNAGVMAVPLQRTQQGFEMQFGTNHLGHFALTGRLLPALLRSDAARVVTVSSNAHKPGRLRRDDLNWEHGRYSRWLAYAQSKLANLLFTAELARRAAEAGVPLVAAAAHPGYAATNLSTSGRRGIKGMVFRLGDRLLGQSAAQGALPQLYAATMPDVEPNDYFGPHGFAEQRGYPKRAPRRKAARSDEDARWLWERSEELTGVSYPWPA